MSEHVSYTMTVVCEPDGTEAQFRVRERLRLDVPLKGAPGEPQVTITRNNREIAHYLRRVADKVERGEI